MNWRSIDWLLRGVLLAMGLTVARSAVLPSDLDEYDRQIIAARPLSASDLAGEAGAYAGQIIRVRSQVTRTFGPHVFELSDEPLLAAPTVLVIVPQPRAEAAQDYMMSVVGRVQTFNRRALEREYSWFKPDLIRRKDLLHQWEEFRVPVLIAQSVQTETGLELVQAPPRTASGLGTFAATQSGTGQNFHTNQPITNLRLLLSGENRGELIGQPIFLRAVRVQRVIDPEWMAVGPDSAHQVAVHLTHPSQSIITGDTVAVSGLVQSTPESWPGIGLGPRQPIFIQAEQAEITH